MADRVGQQLGNYRLIRLLGEGGFAEVYLGEHIYLGTQAAVKVLHTQLTSDDIEQFRTEARTIASLEHPNIVRILDFGVEGKTPFLVMSYAPNGTLRQRHPKGVQLPLATIVSYVKQVADALQYAHDEKLIHRDIKPENMLMGRRNEVLLSDFGIATVAQSSRYQSTQDAIGTVAYMAPEQIQGKPRPASDQYSLGIVVYEWLSGDRPFHGSFTELCAQHMFASPPPLREKMPGISSEVEMIVLTVLTKEPKGRFANMKAFATALEQACQSASSTRNTLPVESTLPSKDLLPTDRVVANTSNQLMLPTNEVTPLSQELQPTIAATPSPHGSPSSTRESVPTGKLQSSQRHISRRAVVIGLAGLAVAGSGLAWLASSQKPGQLALGSSSTHHTGTGNTVTPTATPSPTPIPIGTTFLTYHGHSNWMTSARWSPNGMQIASGSADKTVQVWDATTGNTLYTYRGHSDIVVAAEWSPNGTRIASSGNDRTVQVWDPLTGNNAFTYHGHSNTVYDIAWSPNGTRIASCSWDNTVQIWNAFTGSLLLTYHGHNGYVFSVAWSPDGRWITSAGDIVQVWEASTGNTLYTYRSHTDFVRKAVWSPNGTRIASASHDKTVHIWDATTGDNAVIYQGHSDEVDDIGWSFRRQLIASSGADHTVQIWNPTNASTVFTYRGHSAKINALGWSPNGTRIVSGDDFASVQIWQAV